MSEQKFIQEELPRLEKWTSESGEIIKARRIVKHVDSRKNFHILYLGILCEMFDNLGGAKYKVVKAILEHMDSNNKLIATTRELADKAGTSQSTICRTLEILERKKVISRHTGALILNSKLLMKGSLQKEGYILYAFEELQKNKKLTLSSNNSTEMGIAASSESDSNEQVSVY